MRFVRVLFGVWVPLACFVVAWAFLGSFGNLAVIMFSMAACWSVLIIFVTLNPLLNKEMDIFDEIMEEIE